MAIKLGNTNIGSIYLGSTKISEAYIGSTKIFSAAVPYLIIEFTNSSYVPTVGSGNNYTARFGTWTQVSTSPNRWKWESEGDSGATGWAPGWGIAFSSQDSTPAARLTYAKLGGYCSIIEAGGDFSEITQTDRMFAGCDAITSFCTIPLINGVVTNTAGMYSGCTGVSDNSALTYYNYLKDYGSISNHSGMFTNCGSSTYLADIPTSWGGTWTPTSYAMTSALKNRIIWKIESGWPWSTTITDNDKFNVFTQASVSAYAGVAMNRSNLYNKINGFSNATSAAMYFRPCFMQISNTPSSSSTYVPTWMITTDGYNGTLSPNQGKTDMPGTLDYAAYGPFEHSYGTFNSEAVVYFAFLVTNTPSDQWAGLSGDMAFLYNSNYRTDAGLYYFFDT